ncbi:MAG: TlyA family RNA methyltransferase [Clostridia bacterium]|nr:TlyA family RNA methyltransferase [Clostridia bacterium]
MRIDLYLFENGLAESRTDAKRMITEGLVSVSGVPITKPSYDFSGSVEDIAIEAPVRSYVGRGGLKLEHALQHFRISVKDRSCLDVGASSGGFTDCLLQNGALRVIAVDSGRDQLSKKLIGDGRITSIEGFNARYMSPADLPYVPEVCVMDVSFISATYIIPSVSRCLADNGDFILLIKPQFEVGRENVGKGGIVKSEAARDAAVKKVVDFAIGFGLSLSGLTTSPIKGGDGNIEFLAHFVKRG